MPSARDKCFKKAVEKLKDNGKLKNVDVKDQGRWVRDANSKDWSQTGDIWYKVVGAVSRARKALFGGNSVGDGTPDATRVPDMTLTPEGGKPLVVDNKFDGDSFRDDQLKDYNEINQQQNGDPKAKDLRLDSDVCKCGEPGQTEPVGVPVQAPFAIPGVNPVSPGVLGGAPVKVPTEVPVGEPMFPAGWAPAF